MCLKGRIRRHSPPHTNLAKKREFLQKRMILFFPNPGY
jgi:hypothetical protein